MISKQNLNTISARTSLEKIRSALFIANQDNNVKMVTDKHNKIKTRRKNTYIGTRNIRTLREEGKLEELTHELDRYRWTIVGLSEVCRKGVNEKIRKIIQMKKLKYSTMNCKTQSQKFQRKI